MNEILVDPGMDFNNYRNKMKQLPKKKKKIPHMMWKYTLQSS